MAEKWVTLKQDVYSGGTLAAPKGERLPPERAHVLGVTDDGTVDPMLTTDDLLQRQRDVAAPPPEAASPEPTGYATEKAADLVKLLGERPELADDVEADERTRSEPRSSVLDAVKKARSASDEGDND